MKGNLRKPIAVILMLSMTSLTICPFTQPASAVPVPVPPIVGPALGIVGISIGVTSLILKLKSDDKVKRGEFTQRMVSEFTQKYPDYNVVITHHKGSTAEGPSVGHQHVEVPMAVGSAGYEIFFSPKGQPFKFSLNGDGDYINWAFNGDFNRDGGTLTAK